jgi:hypothetical protein
VPAGAEPVAAAQQAQAETEVRVVVHRLDLDRPLELLTGLGEASAPVVRARERLAHGGLVGLELASPLECDHRSVGVLRREQAIALLERVVRGLHGMLLSGSGNPVCENPAHSPITGRCTTGP